MPGRKSFVVGTRVNGRFRRFTLKPSYSALSLTEARVQAAKIIKDAQRGIDPAEAEAEERRVPGAKVLGVILHELGGNCGEGVTVPRAFA
jgi:hypothetical protein